MHRSWLNYCYIKQTTKFNNILWRFGDWSFFYKRLYNARWDEVIISDCSDANKLQLICSTSSCSFSLLALCNGCFFAANKLTAPAAVAVCLWPEVLQPRSKKKTHSPTLFAVSSFGFWSLTVEAAPFQDLLRKTKASSPGGFSATLVLLVFLLSSLLGYLMFGSKA